MSQYFDLGDETLWDPSNGVARLVVAQVALYEAELGLPSGIGPMESGECQVDPVVFATFVAALLAWHRRTSHGVILTLAEGFVATATTLAARAGIDVYASPHFGAGGEAHRTAYARKHGSWTVSWRIDRSESR